MFITMTSLKAKKYIEDHNNPLVRLEFPHKKFFLRSATNTINEDPLKKLEIALNHERVERRCARARAEWLPDRNLARITKITGACALFGFQNRSGKFMYPEEAFYLLETNRLEIFLNEIPLSILEAYQKMLKSEECNFQKYRVFKNMNIQGYHLVRNLKSEENENEPSPKKRKIQTESPQNHKFSEIFEKLRENSPKVYKPTEATVEPDYYVYLPTNPSRKIVDFKLFILGTEDFSLQIMDDKAIYAVCTDDKVAFYRFGHVNLPNLT